jgi:membrane protease YdiL (CAAX protease family)
VSPTLDLEASKGPRTVPILVAGILGFLGGQIMATVLALVAIGFNHYPGGLSQLSRTTTPPWWSNALGLIGLWTGLAAAIYYAYSYGNLRSLPHQWRPRVSDIGYVALGVGCQLLIDLAYRPFHLKELNRPVHHLFGSAHGLTFALLVVMTMILAPVMEEWFFRGVLFRAISEGGTRANSRRTVVIGVVVSALLFALAHAERVQFVGLALLGGLLAVLVARTRRLVPAVVTHISFNGVAIVALIAQRAGH